MTPDEQIDELHRIARRLGITISVDPEDAASIKRATAELQQELARLGRDLAQIAFEHTRPGTH
jgi:hypothetical protein